MGIFEHLMFVIERKCMLTVLQRKKTCFKLSVLRVYRSPQFSLLQLIYLISSHLESDSMKRSESK